MWGPSRQTNWPKLSRLWGLSINRFIDRSIDNCDQNKQYSDIWAKENNCGTFPFKASITYFPKYKIKIPKILPLCVEWYSNLVQQLTIQFESLWSEKPSLAVAKLWQMFHPNPTTSRCYKSISQKAKKHCMDLKQYKSPDLKWSSLLFWNGTLIMVFLPLVICSCLEVLAFISSLCLICSIGWSKKLYVYFSVCRVLFCIESFSSGLSALSPHN